MTLEEFYNHILNMSEKHSDIELKPFLLSLFQVLPSYEDKPASLENFLKVIEHSLVTPPPELNPSWLNVTSAPTGNRMGRKFTSAGLENHREERNISDFQGMEFTYEVIKFQCAELTSMEYHQLKNELRSLGITSPSGYDWYNFTAFSILECGVACMIDNQDNIDDLDWSFLGTLIEDGRIYE